MTDDNTFRINQVSDSIYNLLCDKIGLAEMSKQSRDWLVFEYNDDEKKLRCYEGYIKERFLLKEIDVELMRYFEPKTYLGQALRIHAPGAWETRVDVCWGLKEDVVEFRKELAAKLLEGI